MTDSSTIDTKDMTQIEELARFINVDVYPLDTPASPAYRNAVAQCQKQLLADGCAHLPGFIKADVVNDLKDQSEAVADLAHFHSNTVTPYATGSNPAYDENHPINRFQEFSNGFVAKDQLPDAMIIKKLYKNTTFQSFIADCLKVERIHEYADPIAGLVINVMPEKTTLPWHFDTNEFIVSLMTRRPEDGGDFQYVPGIREPGDDHFDEVQKVLDGDHTRVKSLTLNTGDLQLFRGRFSMHRVSPAKGFRLCALFGYAETPGMIGRVKRTQDVYGRVTQAHIDAEKNIRADGLEG